MLDAQLTARGKIAVGSHAEPVITDHKMNISAVLLGGKLQP